MLRFAILLCIFAVAMSKQLDYKEWQLYKKAFNRKYNNTDDEFRFKIYSRNVKYIKKHNERFERDQVSYSLGVNRFTDMTNEEVAKKMNGLRRTNTVRLGSTYLYDKNATLPDTVDWRMKGMVTDVKNQGDCGSCWAFSTTGSLEGQHKRKTGKLLSLSEQNLVDCSFKEGNEGCNGGLQDDAFKYIKDNGGIDTEKAYPYEGIDESCQFKRSKIGATVTGFVDIAQGKEDALKHAVATVGPISVGIDANHQEFMSYRSGVLDIPFCSTTTLDHGVLVVGYGTHKGKDYWLVKNSWGKIWGMKGYIMMSRNRKNQCGIASEASYPLV